MTCILKLCQQVYSPIFEKMGLDEQIDSIFERALFVMDDDSNSEINTNYSGSPAEGTGDNSYSGEDQREIEMYATDFENFLELRSEDTPIEKKKEKK